MIITIVVIAVILLILYIQDKQYPVDPETRYSHGMFNKLLWTNSNSKIKILKFCIKDRKLLLSDKTLKVDPERYAHIKKYISNMNEV